MASEKKKEGAFRRATRDVPLKIAALVVALLLWLSVTLLGARTVNIPNVPVSAVNMPVDLGLASELPTVNVRAKVPRTWQADDNLHSLVRAIVDLEGSGVGERNVSVSVIPADSTVSVVSVTPPTIRVTLDPLAERELPVRVVPEGNPADGYRVGDMEVTPDTVQIRGALGMFQDLTSIEALVSVEGADAPVEIDVPVSIPDTLRAFPDTVQVRVGIEQVDMDKTVGVAVQTAGTPASGYFVQSVTPTPNVVQIRGPREIIEDLSTLRTVPVDIDGESSAVEREIELDLPEGVSRTDGGTNILVRVVIAALEDSLEWDGNVAVINVGDGLRVSSVSPASVRVTLRGDSQALSRVREGDVVIAVSVSGEEEGEVRVRPSLSDVLVPAGVQAVAVEDREITIILEEE